MKEFQFRNSQDQFEQALKIFPGGVNSPVRAFGSVKRTPFVVDRGEGPYLFDVDGNRYVDFINSWGPLVLGHAHPAVVSAISEQASKGTSFGACSGLEVALARRIQEFFPSMEMMRFVNSGTEAGMSVIRLARGFTGRNTIVKCNGCYHGHADSLLVKAGSGIATLGIPGCAGVPEDFVKDTIVCQFNNIDSIAQAFANAPEKIAALIIEPVCGNAGLIRPQDGFLSDCRALCDRYGALLIFDEVMTGFRVSLGGAQERFAVRPDLTMLGKVIGGGLPVGAFGGRADIMQALSPLGAVYQAGTLSGNPLAMIAGLRTLDEWVKPGVFESVAQRTEFFVQSLQRVADTFGVALQTAHCGTMFGYFFNDDPVYCFEDAQQGNGERFIKFFNMALESGVYFAPSAFEAGFVSAAHSDEVMRQVIEQIESIFSSGRL